MLAPMDSVTLFGNRDTGGLNRNDTVLVLTQKVTGIKSGIASRYVRAYALRLPLAIIRLSRFTGFCRGLSPCTHCQLVYRPCSRVGTLTPCTRGHIKDAWNPPPFPSSELVVCNNYSFS